MSYLLVLVLVAILLWASRLARMQGKTLRQKRRRIVDDYRNRLEEDSLSDTHPKSNNLVDSEVPDKRE